MSRARILIVEKDRAVAADLEEQLTAMDYEVCGNVASKKEALAAAQRSRPDLVLMDIGIQGNEDGVALAHLLNRQFAVPAIFLTATMDDQTIGRVRPAAPMGCLAKPFRAHDLKAAIEVGLVRKAADLKQKRSHQRLEEKMVRRSQELYTEILARKKIESRLKQTVKELEEANSALVAIVDTRETEIRAIRETIRIRLEQHVLPYVSALEEEVAGREPEAHTLCLLRAAVTKAVPMNSHLPQPVYGSLSTRELKIVDLVKAGKSTKQISQHLNMSPGTVSSYRNKIRKKLGLVNTKTNLRSFLATHRDPERHDLF